MGDGSLVSEAATPQTLYRYRGYTDADVLDDRRCERLNNEVAHALTSEVWFSALATQNDPFDTHPCYVSSKDWEISKFIKQYRKINGPYASFSGIDLIEEAAQRGIRRKQIRKILDNPKTFRDGIRRQFSMLRQDQKICCFSQRGDDILMWSYYSQAHSSFCYRFECLDESLDEARMKVGPVRYLSNRPQISTVDMLQFIASKNQTDKHFRLPVDDDERITNALLLSKSDVWRHEMEWRALHLNPRGPDGYRAIHPYRLTGIVFGCRASETLRKHVASLVNANIALLTTRLQDRSYSLNISS